MNKKFVLAAVLLVLVGSVIGGLSHDMTTLIAGRAVQGLGGGGLILLSFTLPGAIIAFSKAPAEID